MTLSTTNVFNSYDGDGTTTVFPAEFQFWDDAEAEVYLRVIATGVETRQTQTTQYTLVGGAGSSGTVTMLTAPTSLQRVYIRRNSADTQAVDITQGTVVPSAAIEEGLDRAAMRAQEDNWTLANRALLAPITDPGVDMTLPSSVARASKVMAFDSTGKPVPSVMDDQSLLTVLATGSTTARSHAERWVDIYNVKDWGAIGDGVTDDTAACQATIDAVGASGGLVYFPTGNYLVSTLVVAANNITLVGDGYSTQIRGSSGTAWIIDFTAAGNIQRCRLMSMLVALNSGTGTAGGAIRFQRAHWCEIHGVRVENFGSLGDVWDGILFDVSQGALLRDVDVQNVANDGVTFKDSLSVKLDDVICVTIGNVGFTFDTCEAVLASYAWVTTADFGFLIQETIGSPTLAGSSSNFFFSMCSGERWKITKLGSGRFVGCWADEGPGPGFHLVATASGDITSLQFVACRAVNQDTHGWLLDGGGSGVVGVKRVSFTGCHAITNGRTSVGAGIKLTDCRYIRILGTEFETFSSTQDYAIWIDSSVDELVVVGCGLDNQVLAPVNDTLSGTRTNIYFSNCTGLEGVGTVASAATVTLPRTNDFITVTGTADITSITASRSDREVSLLFSGTAATNGVVEGGNLKIHGNFIYTPNSTLKLVSDGTNWVEVSRAPAFPGVTTLANEATPTVLGVQLAKTGGTTTITDFDDGVVGQTLSLLSGHAVTITDGTNILLDGSANFVMAAGDTLTLAMFNDTVWEEVGRKTN